jgi:hypothetical protein
MIEATIYSTLTNDSAVAAIVSARVYPVTLPQEATLPAITYSIVGGPRDIGLGGASGTGRARVRIDCWATEYLAVKSLLIAARAALDALSGAVAAMGEVDFYEDEDGVYRKTIDYYIHRAEE